MALTPERDTMEFSSGLLAGIVLGAGVALLMAPDRSPPARMRRRLRGPRRKVRRQLDTTRASSAEAIQESDRLRRDLGHLGAEFLRAAREEILSRGLKGLGLGAGGQARGPARSGLTEASQRLRELRDSFGRARGS